MKTFVLYARMPRSYWKDIKIAESETKEGIKKYKDGKIFNKIIMEIISENNII